MSGRKNMASKKVTVRMSEEQYLIIRSLALKDKRSTSNQICFLLELAIEALQQMGQQEEETEESEEKPTTDAIGFKVDPPIDEDKE